MNIKQNSFFIRKFGEIYKIYFFPYIILICHLKLNNIFKIKNNLHITKSYFKKFFKN